MERVKTRTYLIAFVITAIVFGTALFVSDYLNRLRIQQIQNIQDRIAIDTLSLETQFDLLEELACSDIKENSVLSGELNSLARRLSFAEGQLGTDDEEVTLLKRQYSLLLIKDLLLMRRITEKCDIDPVFVLYFYSNEGDCEDCQKQGFALTALAEEYPSLRIYAFDYNLDLPALKTLISINEVSPTFPALIIGQNTLYGYQSPEDLQELLPLEQLEEATSTEEVVGVE